MTHTVYFSEEAKLSLLSIKVYLTRNHSLETAKRIAGELVATAKSLRTNPRRFKRIETPTRLDVELRSIAHLGYKIVYQIEDESVIVLDIYHGKRNPPDFFV